MANAVIQIGSAAFDLGTQRLTEGKRDVRLDPKEAQVLLELAAAAPGLVTREHLLAHVWTGTSVGENALDQVIARLRRALGDDAQNPRCIETLRKRGYRLIARVVNADEGGETPVSASSAVPTVTLRPLVVLGAEPTLAEYAHIADEEILRHLAEIKSARVITHEAAGEGKPTFFAQGTVRRVSDQIRVTVQLVRTQGGEVLWSESFDESQPGAVPGQFAVAPFVARTIEAVVRSARRADSLDTRSESARRSFFHGLREMDALASASGGDWFVAVDYFESAVDHDPELTDALNQLAYAYGQRLGQKLRAEQALPRAHRAVRELLERQPDATLSLAYVNHSLDLDYASAMANVEHAQKHGFAPPALAEFHKGLVRYKQGMFDEAIDRMRGSIRAGLGSNEASALYLLADLFFATHRFPEAVAAVERALCSAGPGWLSGQILRIRVAEAMGDLATAEQCLDRLWAKYGESDRHSFPSVLASLGRADLAAEILRENDRSWREGRLPLASYSFGGHYHLGDFDGAFPWLERAIENREWWMFPFLRSSRHYSDIRGDTRFRDAMRRLEAIEATGSPTPSIATAAH